MEESRLSIAIITGASSGLGREFFLALKNEYEEVWLLARRDERLKEIAKERSDVKTRVFKADLSQECFTKVLEEELVKNGKKVSLLINNAGYGILSDFDKAETSSQTGIVRLNDEALVGVTSVVLRHMENGGEIINICSIASFAPNARMAVYSASKAFVMSFSRSLREELKKREINVMAVCPGPMRTEFLSCAGIEKGVSKNFDTLPYCDAKKVAENSLKCSKKKRAVYTPLAFYRFYHFLSRILPTELLIKLAKT